MKGYCSANDVAAFLGVVFTDAQVAAVEVRIGQVERFLDNATGRAWLTGTITNETYYAPFRLNPPSSVSGSPGASVNPLAGYVPTGADILLADTPVHQVGVVRGTLFLGGTETILVENLDYEVRDLATGWIRLTAPSAYYRIRVDYDPEFDLPPDIGLATTALVALWSRPMLNPDTYGLASYELPDLKVTFQSPQRGGTGIISVPPDIQAIVDLYRFRTIA